MAMNSVGYRWNGLLCMPLLYLFSSGCIACRYLTLSQCLIGWSVSLGHDCWRENPVLAVII